MNARFAKLRAKDRTIHRYLREIQRRTDQMRAIHQLRKVARLAIREHEKWLMEEAADQIRREAGVKTIPGFASRRESAREFRQALEKKYQVAIRAASSGSAAGSAESATTPPNE